MPIKQAKYLTQGEKERFFTNLFIKRGMNTANIAYCERRACLKAGEGQEVLKRESVQQRIKEVEDLILDTQNYQRSISHRSACLKSESVQARIKEAQEALSDIASRNVP